MSFKLKMKREDRGHGREKDYEFQVDSKYISGLCYN